MDNSDENLTKLLIIKSKEFPTITDFHHIDLKTLYLREKDFDWSKWSPEFKHKFMETIIRDYVDAHPHDHENLILSLKYLLKNTDEFSSLIKVREWFNFFLNVKTFENDSNTFHKLKYFDEVGFVKIDFIEAEKDFLVDLTSKFLKDEYFHSACLILNWLKNLHDLE